MLKTISRRIIPRINADTENKIFRIRNSYLYDVSKIKKITAENFFDEHSSHTIRVQIESGRDLKFIYYNYKEYSEMMGTFDKLAKHPDFKGDIIVEVMRPSTEDMWEAKLSRFVSKIFN